ncbi:MAG: RNA methyltransferase [Myxococcota bacterium]|nr:RNA methyltransferase [Myxococcota bacterium]
MSLRDIRIVLVEPQHPGNIGAVARAMKTMALANLVLVKPREFPSDEAHARASGAHDVLERAHVAGTLGEAVGDCAYVVGTTSRGRAFPLPLLSARECGETIVREASTGAPAAILFGPERTGLRNQDMDACTHQVRIPTNPEYASLNLGSAVQLLGYEVFLASGEAPPVEQPEVDYPSHSDLEYFYKHLEDTLASRDFILPDMHEATYAKLRRLFGRARPSVGELKLLHSLVKLMDRRATSG